MSTKTLGFCRAMVCLFLFTMGCADDATSHQENIKELSALLPGDARGALAVDISALMLGSSADHVMALFNGTEGDPALRELFHVMDELAETLVSIDVVKTALLVQTSDGSEGFLLIAKLGSDTIGAVVQGSDLASDGTTGAGAHRIYHAKNGNHLALLTGGVVVVGKLGALRSVLDVADGVSPAFTSPMEPFLDLLRSGSPFTFVYGLPAMFNSAIVPDRSLRGAELLSGSIDFSGAHISGSVSFHTSNASEFVDAYNALDKESDDLPLTVLDPIAKGLRQVVVPIPLTSINKTGEELISSRNTLKKLFVGMAAHDYSADVHASGNKAWTDLIVKSEADGDGLPGSVFFRWDFKDPAAVEEFEANELPAGFTLADCQFLETDAPGKFLVLNVYNVTGEIVSESRAEWDIFVNPPAGADPQAGIRPRFMVVDALAKAVTMDSVRGWSSPEPLFHEFDGHQIISSVHKMDGDLELSVFEASFPKPLATDPIARFTREMAIGNDYIYWGNGLYDRVFYNATTFNHDAFFADNSEVQISSDFHWKKYLKEDLIYAVYYVNTLEYVISPMANLDSPYLDITPEWLRELTEFYNMKTSFVRMMNESVEGTFKGRNDVMSRFTVGNAPPSIYYNFRITDPVAMSTKLNLPPGYGLAKTRILSHDSGEDYYLTLSVYKVEDSVEGTRAEWSVYVDSGNGREHFMIIDLQTEDAAVDPVSLINLPSKVDHNLVGDVLNISLSSSMIDFDASFSTVESKTAPLYLDWIEAGDYVCHINGICDKLFYDAETLDVPVNIPGEVSIDTIKTPWNEFIDTMPRKVFYRNNMREQVVKPWHNLKVFVEDPPPPDLSEEGTHVISGTGTLTGRDNPAFNATYTYAGNATLDGNELFFVLDQHVSNSYGEAHFISNGSFDIVTGAGTATFTACSGDTLVCANIDPLIGTPAATSQFAALNLDASDTGKISWDLVSEVTIPSFGTADANSHLVATAMD